MKKLIVFTTLLIMIFAFSVNVFADSPSFPANLNYTYGTTYYHNYRGKYTDTSAYYDLLAYAQYDEQLYWVQYQLYGKTWVVLSDLPSLVGVENPESHCYEYRVYYWSENDIWSPSFTFKYPSQNTTSAWTLENQGAQDQYIVDCNLYPVLKRNACQLERGTRTVDFSIYLKPLIDVFPVVFCIFLAIVGLKKAIGFVRSVLGV